MKRTRIAFVLPVLLALAACDGGSRGSGITTAEGNVSSVQTALRAPSTAPTMGKMGWLAWLWRRSELEGRAEADAGVAGIRVLLEQQPVYAYMFEGVRYDAGDKLGFLKATVEFALRRTDLGDEFRQYLRSLKL